MQNLFDVRCVFLSIVVFCGAFGFVVVRLKCIVVFVCFGGWGGFVGGGCPGLEVCVFVLVG